MDIQTRLSGDFKKILQEEAYEIESLLKRYIAVHNKRLKSAGTFSSLFRKVNFKEILDEVNDVFWEFEQKETEIMALRGDYTEYSPAEKEFYDCLEVYFDDLFETVELLQVLSTKQFDLSQGLGKGKLTLKEDLALENKYKSKIKDYMENGQKLNNLFEKIKNEN